MVGVLWVGDVKPGAKRLVGQRESSVDLRFNVIWFSVMFEPLCPLALCNSSSASVPKTR